jgi:hypothetical protein
MSANTKPDPFNFPMPNRCDGMSLSVMNIKQDAVKTKTHKFNTSRIDSINLSNTDIEGKSPQKIFI